MSVNPRSKLTRRTPEGPMEKRSGKDVLALFHYRVYAFPEQCLRYELIQVTDECLVPLSQHVIGIFLVHGPT